MPWLLRCLLQCLLSHLWPRFGGEPQSDPGAALAGIFFGHVVQLDAAAVLFENPADDCQAEAGTLLSCRDIGFQQSVAIFLGQPDAVVDHINDDVAAFADRRNANMAAPTVPF